MFLYLYLFILLCISLLIYISNHLFLYLSLFISYIFQIFIYIFMHLFITLFIHNMYLILIYLFTAILSLYPSIIQKFIHPSIFYLSSHPPSPQKLCLSNFQISSSTYLSIYIYHLCIYLFIYLSKYLSIDIYLSNLSILISIYHSTNHFIHPPFIHYFIFLFIHPSFTQFFI